jgi:hypothetical protein
MPTYSQTTGKNIQDAFEQFNASNPQVYKLFTDQVLRAANAGKKRVSAKQILGHIRWEVFMQTKEPTLFNDAKQFKINDAYTSRYSRLFIKNHPEMESIFENRRIRSY